MLLVKSDYKYLAGIFSDDVLLERHHKYLFNFYYSHPNTTKMRPRVKKDMYVIEFPSGTKLKLSNLDWASLQTLKDQCTPREILKIVSVETHEDYFLSEKKRNGLFFNDSIKYPFLTVNGEKPPRGNYTLFLKDNIEMGIEISVCGSLNEFVDDTNCEQKLREILGPHLKFYIQTCPQAVAKYNIAVIGDKLYFTLDYKSSVERILTVQSPQNIIDTSSIRSFGGIPGQICILAQILPYSILLQMVDKCGIQKVIFTGAAWSGTIAHAAAIIFREQYKSSENPPSVAAISFSGPLCGSPALQDYLIGQRESHTTINCDGDILDRLLVNFQRISAFADKDVESWKLLHDTFYQAVKHCHEANAHAVDLDALKRAEENLNYRKLSDQDMLSPIGFLMLKGDRETILIGSENLLETIYSLTTSVPQQTWRHHYSLKLASVSTWPTQDGVFVNPKLFSPCITDVSMIQTPTKFSINFEGQFLDCMRMRLFEKEVPVTTQSINNLPFNVEFNNFDIQSSQAKILRVRCFPNKATVDLSGLSLVAPGNITLKTDFGETNSLPYTDEKIIGGNDLALSKQLHPTMNAEYLSSALLRVAITAKASGGLQNLSTCNPAMYDLWLILLDLEKNIFNLPEVLNKNMTQYLDDIIDIGQLKHMCMRSVFEEVSRLATMDMPVKQVNGLYRGLQYIVGGSLAFTGGLITLAAVLLSVPAAILAIPVLSVVNNADRMHAGTRAYVGVVGVVGLPAVIVGTIGMFLAAAGAYAISDYASHNYRQMLQTIIELLGGNSLEVVDELPQLEDCIMTRLSVLFPDLDLCRSTELELKLFVKRGIEKQDEKIKAFSDALKKYPIMTKKLLMIARIHAIRQILIRNLMIGFVGVHNAGKSTTISRLLEVDAKADLIVRTEGTVPYLIGGWVDDYAKTHSQFSEWLNSKDRNSTQLYAVDFPGTTDEREAISTVTRYTAELVSIFVVVLRAAHIAAPEKDVVDIVKANNKPFIVIINQCDSIAHDLRKPGNDDRIRNHYAQVLGVTPSIVQFACALDSSSNDRVRGIIFGMLQSLINNYEIVKTIALRLIPPSAVKDIDESFMGVPDTLSAAAYSLLFNLCPVRREMLEATCRNLLRDTSEAHKNKSSQLDLLSLSFGAMDIVREIAMRCGLAEDEYNAFLYIINHRNIVFYPSFEKIAQNHDDIKKHVQMVVTTMSLASLQQEVYNFLKKSASKEADFNALATDVLLGLRDILNRWVNTDCSKIAVLKAMTIAFESVGDKDEFVFLNKVKEQEDSISLMASQVEAKELSDSMIEISLVESDIEHDEIARYRLGKDHLSRLNELSFQPCNMFSDYQRNIDTSNQLSNIKKDLGEYAKQVSSRLEIPISRGDDILSELLEHLGQLTKEHMSCDLRFQIKNDKAIDVDGVTKSIITRAAYEIAEHPEKVL